MTDPEKTMQLTPREVRQIEQALQAEGDQGMMRYATLAELHAAYETGELSRDCLLWIDNDQAVVHRTIDDDYETVFEMHPEDLLEQALDLLGIPRNHV